MPPEAASHSATAALASAEKSKAALSSILWSGLLTVMKLVAALSSNSLGLLSEALHSALDLVAAGITFIAVKISAVPADANHPYGHGKVENLSALAETLLLVLTCIWIVRESIERLFFQAAPVEPSWWVFGVVIISLVVDINRSAMLRRVAKAHRSQALEADALHFTTDIWSSSVVLVGLLCVVGARYADPDGSLHMLLAKADAVAALGVAVIILKVSWDLACRSIQCLMDGGNEEEAKQVRKALARYAPAYAYRRIRVRESGAGYFVEVEVELPPGLRVDVVEGVNAMLKDVVENTLPGAETTITILPAQCGEDRDLFTTCHRLAAEQGLDIHNLILSTLDDGLHVFVHIELDPDKSLAEAHAAVDDYEQELARRIGAVHVVSHIEPKSHQEAKEEAEHCLEGNSHILAVLEECMAQQPDLCEWYDVRILTVGNRTALSFRCKTKHTCTVGSAHHLSALLESDLRCRLPLLGRITIHVEPS